MSSQAFGCTDVPVVIRWGDAEPYNYIGTRIQHLRMNINLGTEASPELLFWFSVTVGVKASPESSTTRIKSLYFVIQASSLDFNGNGTPLTLENPNSDYSLNTSAAIQEAGICSDQATVARIRFQLHDHGTVFMHPIDRHAFTPASENVSQLLVSMQSLSQAEQFWVYTSLEGPLLTDLWKRIDLIRRGTFASDFTTQSVYKHGMVCDKWTNFNLFARNGNSAKRQGAGMKRKDSDRLSASDGASSKNLPSSDRDQRLVDTETGEEPHREPKRKHSKTVRDATPSGILENVAGPSGFNSNTSCTNDQSSRVRFAEPYHEVSDYLEEQLAAFIFWVLGIDTHLERDCDQVFSDLGGAVLRGDMTEFIEIKSMCMAKIYCTYAKRGSAWVLRNAF
ncbi:ea26924f-abbe-4b0a-bc1e-e8ac2056d291 [Sclerotinia trifoliorum]|uniref:Ea26924f-abbe-4b0a-bc1e-e8ac2056d291 n=1 Tax=Sclerotinia trifoliorum TaxID=28548 RepID=A0A8H2VRC8_9HELO|nr:ea26924f-abbe-4b0a-bc1e-e8ac2056d291 [Sclerotinia trifoliorum]